MGYYNTSARKYNTRRQTEDVRGAKLNAAKNLRITFLLGILLGVLMPFLVDIAMFGTPMPCHTIESLGNGDSIQKCEVRR